jgi:hypothetical protein
MTNSREAIADNPEATAKDRTTSHEAIADNPEATAKGRNKYKKSFYEPATCSTHF